MSIDQSRRPPGAPTGGQFAVTARAEPALNLNPDPLPDPEHDADALLAGSALDAGRLTGRMQAARDRLAEARTRMGTAASLPGRSEDLLFWTERAVAAEDDLTDLRMMHDRTVVGLAALTVRHDRALRDLAQMGSGSHPVDPDAYEAARQDLHRATDALHCASDPDLTLVFGGEDMPDDLHGRWADIGMVAAPVTDPDRHEPKAWRVSFVDVRAGAEVARLTVPAEHTTAPHAPDRLDKGSIAAHITWLAARGDQPAADLAARLPSTGLQAA